MSRIVCAWYTPEYAPWADKLRASCEEFGENHDIREVPRLGAEWASETRRKAGMAAHFLLRHSNKNQIILLDADCVLKDSLDHLAAEAWSSGVALYARPKMRVRNHIVARSGTMVLRNSYDVIEFTKEWEFISRQAEKTATDQDTLITAMCNASGINFRFLSQRYCATELDIAKGEIAASEVAILHSSASAVVGKKESSISKLSRKVRRIVRGEAA